MQLENQKAGFNPAFFMRLPHCKKHQSPASVPAIVSTENI
jgi:hypothetical protein